MLNNLLFCILLISTFCTKYEVIQDPLPLFTDPNEFLKKTKNRPDFQVRFFIENPDIWKNNNYYLLYYSESLFKIQKFEESIVLNLKILNTSNRMKSHLQAKNYFLLAQNYAQLNLSKNATEFFNKTLPFRNSYYTYRYAQFEENQQNYGKALLLYEKALELQNINYIKNAYARTLEKSLLHNQKQSLEFQENLEKLRLLDPIKAQIYEIALIK